jgi:hypothetical protein
MERVASGADLARGAIVSGVDVVFKSGTTQVASFTNVPFGPAQNADGVIPGGVEIGRFDTSTFDIEAFIGSGIELTPVIQVRYNYYVDGVQLAAVNKAETELGQTNLSSGVVATSIADDSGAFALVDSGHKRLVVTLAGAEFRSASDINSGNVIFNSGLDVNTNNRLSSTTSGFTLLGLSEDKTVAVFQTPFDDFGTNSGFFKILPSAYFQTSTIAPTVSISSIAGLSSGSVALANGVASSGADNVIKLTLNGAQWRGSFTSGMFEFAGLNSGTIAASITAGNILRGSDTILYINSTLVANSGLTISGLTVNSGAFIQTGANPSLTIEYSKAQLLSGLSVASSGLSDAAGAENTISSGFKIVITEAEFKSISQGFNPANIVLTGSGSAVVTSGQSYSPKQIADSVASVLTANLRAGNYSLANTSIIINVTQPLVTLDNQIVVTINPAALRSGNTSADRLPTDVTITRADS